MDCLWWIPLPCSNIGHRHGRDLWMITQFHQVQHDSQFRSIGICCKPLNPLYKFCKWVRPPWPSEMLKSFSVVKNSAVFGCSVSSCRDLLHPQIHNQLKTMWLVAAVMCSACLHAVLRSYRFLGWGNCWSHITWLHSLFIFLLFNYESCIWETLFSTIMLQFWGISVWISSSLDWKAVFF